MKPYASFDSEFDLADLDCAGLRENGRSVGLGKIRSLGGDVSAMNSQRKGGKRRVRTALNKRARTALKRDLRSRLAE